LKNQINLKKEDRYQNICKTLIDILKYNYNNFSNHFEISFLQQIIGHIRNDDLIFEIFIKELLQKYFKGRNVIIKNNDIKFLIKATLNLKGPLYFLEHIFKFCMDKESGGARTTHQLNQVIFTITLGF
jgi:hypothetical protein